MRKWTSFQIGATLWTESLWVLHGTYKDYSSNNKWLNNTDKDNDDNNIDNKT